MPKENKLDRVTDIVMGRVGGAVNAVSKEYKGANPYRQTPVEPKQQLYNYMQYTPEDWQTMKQTIDPLIVDNYIAKMETLREKYGGQ